MSDEIIIGDKEHDLLLEIFHMTGHKPHIIQMFESIDSRYNSRWTRTWKDIFILSAELLNEYRQN